MSRQFSVFELTKALAFRDPGKAVRLAGRIGQDAKFAMPMAVSALFMFFNRVLKYGVLIQSGRGGDRDAKAKVLQGVNPYFYKEYDSAVRNFPVPKAMRVISLLSDYDYKGKGGDVGEATPGELLVELVTKILNI